MLSERILSPHVYRWNSENVVPRIQNLSTMLYIRGLHVINCSCTKCSPQWQNIKITFTFFSKRSTTSTFSANLYSECNYGVGVLFFFYYNWLICVVQNCTKLHSSKLSRSVIYFSIAVSLVLLFHYFWWKQKMLWYIHHHILKRCSTSF